MSSILRIDNIKNLNQELILDNGTLKNAVIDETCSFSEDIENYYDVVVNHKFTSSNDTEINLNSSAGLYYIGNTEINMGIPKKENNWYRLYFYSGVQDASSSNGGIGFSFYRKVGTGSFTRVLGQGIHANYDNAMTTWGNNHDMLAYIPAANATDEHSFRVYVHMHSNYFRVNKITNQNELFQGGFNNNIFEITEYDGDFVNNGRFERY
jgi:hypothetical protein